jgi:uncharacterized protein involved in exopolysaccharide biosynthesis
MEKEEQREVQYRSAQQFEDEIELIDYLRVIWKWKYLIVSGTLIFAVAVGMISLSMPKVYRIDMLVRLGILDIDEYGRDIYIDRAENVQAMIEAGTFDREILDHMGGSHSNDLADPLRFKVNILAKSNTLKVSYRTSDVNRGLQILANLGQALSEKYSERVAHIQNKYQGQLDLKKGEVSYCEAKKRASEQHMKNLQKRIEELTTQIELVRKNTTSLIRERDKSLSNSRSEDSMISPLFYMNTIQHNMSLENSYRQERDNYVIRKEDEKFELEELNRQLAWLAEEIKGLEILKKRVPNIEILQRPIAGSHPIKPKIKLNVMLATGVGLFVMLFLAFFLEYIQRYRGEHKL